MIQYVASFKELVSTQFQDQVNALCWRRELPGDYAEVVGLLDVEVGITTLDDDDLRNLPLSDSGKIAVEQMIADQQMLRDHDLQPELDCVNGYEPVENPGPLATDVCSFHVDSATVEADTFLCSYFGASSEGLANDQAIRHVDHPETRARLLKHYGGDDDTGFIKYLSEHYFDLHYLALPNAKPFSFGVGSLWRIATKCPGSPVAPCIHRAPAPVAGQPPRLLLIS